jgi:2-methylcitrate dehydratase PrpD
MSYTADMANYFGNLTYESLPPAVIRQAKICLLDFLGISIGASLVPEAKDLGKMIESWGDREEASVLGLGFKTSTRNASFCNAVLSALLEVQDGLNFRGIHIAESVPPAVLALGESCKTDGRKLITSLVVGYEVAGRIAEAMFPTHFAKGFMPTGTVGAFGAAAGAAKLLRLGPEGIQTAMGIVVRTLPMSIEYEDNKLGGYTAKYLHGAQAAKAGIEAAFMAQAGVTAYPEPLAGSERLKQGFCFMGADNPNMVALTEDLGRLFYMPQLYFKPYPACRQIHSAIEVALNMARQNDIRPDEVEEIRVRTYKSAVVSTGQNYTNPQSTFISCQFSLPYVVAASIQDKRFGLDQLSAKKIADPSVHALAAKVKAIEVPEITEAFPGKTISILEIAMTGNRVLTDRTDYAKGDPKNPMQESDFVEKFLALTGSALREETKHQMVAMIMDLENLDDTSALIRLVSGRRRNRTGKPCE